MKKTIMLRSNSWTVVLVGTVCLLTLAIRMSVEFSQNLISDFFLLALFYFFLATQIALTIFMAICSKKTMLSRKQQYLMILIAALTTVLAFSLPYKKIYVNMDQSIFLDERIEVVDEIRNKELVVAGDGTVHLINEEKKQVGAIGVYVYRVSEQNVGIFFETNSGLLETSSGFMYVTRLDGADSYPYIDQYTVLFKLEDNWSYGSFS